MRRLLVTMVLSVLSLLAIAGSVSAEEIRFVSANEFSATQARLDELESRLASYEHGASFSARGSNVCDNRSAGLIAGGEVTFLKAGHASGSADFSYKASPRVWLGYETCSGLGVRGRWFDYDSQSSGQNFMLTGLDITTVDLEVTDTFRWGNRWEGAIAGGVRYADCQRRIQGFMNIDLSDGYGPLLGIELKRCVTERISLFGMARESLILCDAAANGGDLGNMGYSITELQLGAEYRRPWRCGSSVFARGAVEAQYWSSTVDSEIGLFGGSFAIGMAR